MEPKSKESEVVIDQAGTSLSDLWKKEDYWAIWLGVILLIIALIIFLPRPPADMKEKVEKSNLILKQESTRAPIKTLAWHNASIMKSKIRATNENYAKTIKDFLAPPSDWHWNPVKSVYQSQKTAEDKQEKAKSEFERLKSNAEEALAKAKASESAAEAAGFQNESLNNQAVIDINRWLKAQDAASKAKSKTTAKPFNHLPYWIALSIVLSFFFGIGIIVMGKPFGRFLLGFFFVFFLAILAYMMEVQQTMKYYGFGYPLWAIIFGMLISNTIGTPEWVKPALQTEFYIKTGLVLLGGEVLLNKILAIGVPGIFVAWVVTPVVLISTYWFGQRVIKIPSKTLNITISADMSVCGVSAAIATSSACRAKKEELTLAIGLSMVFTSVMMVALPTFIKAVGMDHVLGRRMDRRNH